MPPTPEALTRVYKLMSEAGLDLLLLNAPANVWAFSGYPLAFSGLQIRGYARNAVVIIPFGREPILVVGAFEEQISRARAGVADIETFRDYLVPPVSGAAEVVRMRGLPCRTIGIERTHLSVRFSHLLRESLPESDFVSADGLLDQLQTLKTPHELMEMESTFQLASRAVADALTDVTSEISEVQLHRKIVVAVMRALWSERVDGSVLSGQRILSWNGQASEVKLAPGDWVRLDYTFMRESFAGRLCRMGTVGSPSRHQELRFRKYVDACTSAIGRLRAGQSGAEVHEIFRAALADHELDDLVGSAGFGLGYGPVHPPYLVPGEGERLYSGMTLSIEPMADNGMCANWIIVVEKPGVRIFRCDLPAERLFHIRIPL